MLKEDFCFPFLMTLKRIATVAGSNTCNLKPYHSGILDEDLETCSTAMIIKNQRSSSLQVILRRLAPVQNQLYQNTRNRCLSKVFFIYQTREL